MDEMAEQDLGEKAAHILYPLFIGQVFGIIFTAATFIVVARILQPVKYGVYIFAFGFSALVNGFAGFGIGAYFSNILAKQAYRREGEAMLRTLTSGYIVAGIVGIFLTLFGVAISGYVTSLYPNVGITALDLMLAAGTIVFLLLNTISVSALIGLSRTGLGAVVNILVDFVQLALSIILSIKFGVEGAIMAMLVGYAFGAILGIFLVFVAASKYIQFRIAIPALSHIWDMFVTVTPVAWTNFLNTGMQNFSILFLGLYVATAELGNFGAASKGLALMTMIYTALGSGLFPIFTTAKVTDTDGSVNSTYNKIIRFAILLMLPIVVYVGAMAQPGLALMVTGEFTTAPSYLFFIAIGTMLGLFGGYVNNLLISEGYTKSVLKINAISAVIQLVCMVLLVPALPQVPATYRVYGVIFTIFFLGNIAEALLFANEAKKLFRMKFEFRHLLLLYLANFFLGALLYGIYYESNALIMLQGTALKSLVELLIGFVFVVVVYPPILVLFRALSLHDIRSMRHATLRLGRMSFVFTGFFDYAELVYVGVMGERPA